MFNDLIVELDPPPKRQGKCTGGKERHLTEAAVMLAYRLHLLRTIPELTTVTLHPDGEHGKRFGIAPWLTARGFVLTQPSGTTSYCGTYIRDQQSIEVRSIPERGDVLASTQGVTIVAECKGGIVNTRHPGQISRLRRGLCETIGQLMGKPKGGRQIAVVPCTEITRRLAEKMAPRAYEAGIEIALVDEQGQVIEMRP